MAAYGRIQDPSRAVRRIAPASGPPVRNMRGVGIRPGTGYVRPLAAPAVAGGPPGPAPGTPPPVGIAPPPAVIPGDESAAPGTIGPYAPSGAWQKPAPGAGGGGGGGGGAAAAPAGSSTEDLIRSYISDTMRDGATPPGQIDRMKTSAFQAATGGLGQTNENINQDATRRGIFKSSIPANSIAAAERGAGSDYTKAVADIMNKTGENDAAAKAGAAGLGMQLLQSDREDAARQNALAAQSAAANRNKSFTYIDPDTGESFELPTDIFGDTLG